MNEPLNVKKKALIIGASRGLGLAIAKEFLARNWCVTGTVRQESGTALHDLAQNSSDQLQVEVLDITATDQILSLKDRLQGQKFDLLFVNAGISHGPYETTITIATDEFVKVMVTNALSPMRVIETLESNVIEGGTIGVMSSGQGSIADNEIGFYDVYRASKAALNMLMRSFAARHPENSRSLLLIAPGWIRTALGGPDAPSSIEEAIPHVVDTIVAQTGKVGLQYLNQFGKVVRW